MNQDKFQNQLALRLGKNLIVREKRFTIYIDNKRNPQVPWIIMALQGCIVKIGFFASADPENEVWTRCINKEQKEIITTLNIEDEVRFVVNSVHEVYQECINDRF